VERVGGYDPSLRARAGQGCEDLKLYLLVAEQSEIAFLRDPLTAYRQGQENMSGDTTQMLRSFDMVAAEFCARRPELRRHFNAHRVYMLCWLINGTLRSHRYVKAAGLGGHLISTPSLALPHAIAGAVGRRLAVASQRALRNGTDQSRISWLAPLNGPIAHGQETIPRASRNEMNDEGCTLGPS